MSNKEKKENELLQSRHAFREQCYLVARLPDLVKQNQKTKYQKFTALGGISNSQTVNRLLKFKDFDKLTELTSAQIAALVPKIRVFSIDVDKKGERTQKEYKFQGGFMNLKSILEDPGSRGRNIGIKKFDFDFLGTDAFTAGKTIGADLTLFGDSLRVFEDPHYERLLLRSPVKGIASETKVIVGWSVPSSNMTGIISPALRRAIESDTLTLVMTLTKHNFSFNQDGSFKLTLSYIGAIDSALEKINLTGPGSEKEARQDVDDDKGLVTGAEIAGDLAFQKAKDIQQATKPKSFSTIFGESQEVSDIAFYEDADSAYRISEIDGSLSELQIALGEEFPGADEKISDILASDPDQAKQKAARLYRSSFIKSRTTERYQRILNSIEKLDRIYNLAVSQDDLEDYFETYGSYKTKSKKPPSGGKSKPSILPQAPPIRPAALLGALGLSKSSGGSLKTGVDRPSSESGKTHIPFIFLGDLMEGVLGALDYQLKKYKIKIILGTMIYENFQTGKEEIVSLADIPISVSRFSAWFHENFVKRIATKITFSRFLTRMMTELITPAFGKECFDGLDMISKGASNRVSFLSMVGGNKIPTGRIKSVSAIDGKLRSRNASGDLAKTEFNYIVISSNNDPSPDFDGKLNKDKDLGIVHLRLGQDRGLLKNASFNKMNDPNLVASRIVKESGDAFSRAWEPYNVDLTLIGNNYFRPGTYFYLVPTMPGRGGTAIASKLGLGGYYLTQGMSSTVSPAGFETTVRGLWQTSPSVRKNKKKKRRSPNVGGEGIESVDAAPQKES